MCYAGVNGAKKFFLDAGLKGDDRRDDPGSGFQGNMLIMRRNL
jgi:hypothetical protein